MKTIKKLEIKSRRISLDDMIAENRIIYSSAIRAPENVVPILRSIFNGEDQEIFIALYLDVKNKILGYSEVGRGTMESCVVDLRVLFRPAILLGASNILVAHNHPSQDYDPSAEDIDLTNRVVKAGKLLGSLVLDHVIVSDNGYFSFAENGFI